tara:strand:+ start:1357 stop:2100 length:744 start_codon:yes stop_codon:yes gene_type:complete
MANKLEKYIIDNKKINDVFNINKSLNYPLVKNSGLKLNQIISRIKEMNKPRLNIKGNPSIAVIGNSGILLDNEFGKEIDSHDLIIRCNLARVKGFEKHVGSKTSIRCIAGKSFWYNLEGKMEAFDDGFIPNLNETLIIKATPLNNAIQGAVKNFHSKNTIHYFNDQFLDYCNSLCKSSDVTVGFCATVLACAISKNVSVYGFNFFKENDWGKKHYFEKITPYKQGHNFKDEEEYFKVLEKQNFISIR